MCDTVFCDICNEKMITKYGKIKVGDIIARGLHCLIPIIIVEEEDDVRNCSKACIFCDIKYMPKAKAKLSKFLSNCSDEEIELLKKLI